MQVSLSLMRNGNQDDDFSKLRSGEFLLIVFMRYFHDLSNVVDAAILHYDDDNVDLVYHCYLSSIC